MSWDVFIQHLPAEAKRVADVPDGYEGEPLGTRSEVISRIRSRFPEADFHDAEWGKIARDDYAIDITMNGDDPVTGLTLHVRGGDDAVNAVSEIIEVLNARGLDSWTGELFDPAVAVHSIRRWRAYVEELE